MKTFAVIAVAGFAIFLLTAVYLLRGGYRSHVSPAVASTDSPLSIPGNAMAAELQKLVAQMEVRDQKMLSVARGILTSVQYSHYQQYQANRHDMIETSLGTTSEGK